MAYLLSPQGGLKVLRQMGQPPFVPCRVPDTTTKEKLPQVLGNLVEVRQ
jgi:molybdate/tungstate transport system substrate-binding protein